MIEKCNFKSDVSGLKPYRNYEWECDFTHNRCPDEENCILFQLYKSNANHNFSEDGLIRIFCDYHGHMAIRKEDDNDKCPHCGKDVSKW